MAELLYSRAVRCTVVLLAGPIGCSALYFLFFIARPFDPGRYPDLAAYFTTPGLALEAAFFLATIAGSATYFYKASGDYEFRKTNPSMPSFVLLALTLITAALMAFTVYRVFGTLDLANFATNYAAYYKLSRIGGAWIIYAGYGILFVMLADMFFGGVNRANASFFLICVSMNMVTGGRTLPLLLMLAFLFLLYFQRPRVTAMLTAVAVCALIGSSGYLSASFLRSHSPAAVASAPEEFDPTNQWETLNYDAAFILDDVTRRLADGTLSPEAHMVSNSNLFVPRVINPDKLKSDSETRLVYPDVAERGTTISFPLKANLMLNLGGGSIYYLNWLVVALFQVGLIWALVQRQRKPTLLALVVFFFGSVYFLIERAGLLNTRLVIHLLILLFAYVCYRAVTASWSRMIPNSHTQPSRKPPLSTRPQ